MYGKVQVSYSTEKERLKKIQAFVNGSRCRSMEHVKQTQQEQKTLPGMRNTTDIGSTSRIFLKTLECFEIYACGLLVIQEHTSQNHLLWDKQEYLQNYYFRPRRFVQLFLSSGSGILFTRWPN